MLLRNENIGVYSLSRSYHRCDIIPSGIEIESAMINQAPVSLLSVVIRTLFLRETRVCG